MLTLIRKALPIGMLLVGWFGRASQDGTITLVELIALAQAMIIELELPLTIAIPPELGPAFGLAPADPGSPPGANGAAPVCKEPAPAEEAR